MAHNLPPASPNLSAQALATHFALHHNAILFGNSMAALVGVLSRSCQFCQLFTLLIRNRSLITEQPYELLHFASRGFRKRGG
jgi:hypothetical protein